MPPRSRIRIASQIVGRLGGYYDTIGESPACEKQTEMVGVACETLTRYMLGEMDEDSEFDGLDHQCLAIAAKIRQDPEWNNLSIGDRFAVKHRKVVTDDGSNAYAIWLEQIVDDEPDGS